MNHHFPSPTDLQSHIYASLLQGTTPDVALRIRGTWSAVYRLHRVVLIQSGFFQSLFTAGFVESSLNRRSPKYGCDIVDLVFTDRNITRAVCIARLYGGGPPLHVPSALVPTADHPLTPSFPAFDGLDTAPSGHQLATPFLLLSLLATSIYLSIPSIATQALSIILSTVGPTTVIPYLNFALGKPLITHQLSLDGSQSAVGLESLALPIGEDDHDLYPPLKATKPNDLEDVVDLLSSATLKDDPCHTSIASSDESSSTDSAEQQDDDIVCHYGAVSNKIGEACSCWLARWAADMLSFEADRSQSDLGINLSVLSNNNRSQPSSFPPSNLVILGRGGLSAKWVAALVASDTLFVKNERHRYDFARRVVEMRRAEGVLPEEENEWATMFKTGIYYTNMSMEDIIAISCDTSSVTKEPFVPLRILQAAHWSQSVLRHKITSLPPSPYPPLSSGTAKEKELGVALSTADILSQISNADLPEASNPEAQKAYYLVPNDSSRRIGDNGTAFNNAANGIPMSMDEIFKFTDSPSVPASHSSNGRTVHKQSNAQAYPLTTSESTFFGLLSSRQTASSCVVSDPSGKAKWTPHPPCRFSVEFWDFDVLREKNRLYSNTIWYAGSLFNVYIQIVRKKGQGQTQLGVYVHRQSSIDSIPQPSRYIPSTPPDNHNSSESQPGAMRIRNGPTALSPIPLHYSPSIYPLAYAPNSARPSSPASNSSSPSSPSPSFSNNLTTRAPTQPYRDPRPMITAYFTASCASATGSSQTRFSSAPDAFSIGQSWGWKSSSLKSEEYVDIGADEDFDDLVSVPRKSKPKGKEVSFRATVVLGLV
ncbi:hypothetical protein AGABI2DRAFT_197803 [Agaricus bisporus var. bisporus H97]|uniref:hypothetical protein n=1 Tax=Agaricus bisporus var. bisporus (strain H97 / ATCC MYA-4626 / FGSC 10389) TaxID=936046 RepID=UPI00029F5CE2|nr:hypothetical protein AGABI2DRAFT_197803 [Agaricus bisporus var. bisporus H97]EKV51565.1 hypothetical protein AGABI2DRAFT_197803 [Agaricus bisporus var. bisporus H97]